MRKSNVHLSINEHYAKAFEYRKEREELDRLKAKYGSDYDPNTSESGFSTDSESAESEDEHGEELTLTVDAAILRTLARIKDKDPAIYDSSKNIFGEEQKKIASKSLSTKGSSKSRTKSKPVTIRQANIDSILHGSRSPSPEDDPRPPTYVQEQENLRKDTISAFHSAVPEGDGDDFLVARAKAKDEFELEDEEYRTFLEREVGDLKNLVSIDRDRTDKASDDGEQSGHEADEAQKASKKKKKNEAGSGSRVVKEKKSRAEKDQEFLMNYILNRGWIDRSERYIPTYEEVTSTKGQKDKAEAMVNDLNKEEEENGLFSDSSFDSLASHFEASYNHRFEEPGAAAIPTFPRNIQSTVRRQDTTRKEARERRKARKEEELAKKREEVKMLKALKMREVKRKLEVIGRQAGLKGKGKGKIGQAEDEDDDFVDEALRELDLEGDWNPEKHDQQMAGLFDREDVFEDDVTLEGDGDEDSLTFVADGKPVWEDEIDIGNIAMPGDNVAVEGSQEKRRKKKKKGRKGQGDDDVGVDIDAMDADADVVFEDDDEWDGTEEMRKRVLKRYMDELDNLDFNDMVGDLPTRFKYVPIQSNDYSLTPAEILMATDKELNEYMSVKKYAPYRLSKADNRHRFAKAHQEKLWELKSKVAERKGTGFGQEPDGGLKVKKRKGKKERMKMKSELDAAAMATTAVAVAVPDDFPSGSTKRKRGDENETGSFVADDGSDKEGVPKKTKRKRKHRKEGEFSSNAVEA